MTDRPIIFSAPTIRALLAGTKTQTRRIVKIRSVSGTLVPIFPPEKLISLELDGTSDIRRGEMHYESTAALSGPYPIGFAVGDRLWVRETWRIIGAGSRVSAEACRKHRNIEYRADGYEPIREDERSPIHMPRWASRLTLTVTDVRVQRLQDISEDDARAEGIEASGFWRKGHPPSICFSVLWDSIHGPGAWNASPWVAALTFTVARGNIGALEPARGAQT